MTSISGIVTYFVVRTEEGLHAKAASPSTQSSCAIADWTPISCTPGVCVLNAVLGRLLPGRAPDTFKPAFQGFGSKRGTFAYLTSPRLAFFAPPDLPEPTRAATTMFSAPSQTQNARSFIFYEKPPKPKSASRRKPLQKKNLSTAPASNRAGDTGLASGRHS
jgi:hypothetical protein